MARSNSVRIGRYPLEVRDVEGPVKVLRENPGQIAERRPIKQSIFVVGRYYDRNALLLGPLNCVDVERFQGIVKHLGEVIASIPVEV